MRYERALELADALGGRAIRFDDLTQALEQSDIIISSTGSPDFNRLWTLLGLPCANVPGFADAAGLPLGVQLVGTFRQDGVQRRADARGGGVLAEGDALGDRGVLLGRTPADSLAVLDRFLAQLGPAMALELRALALEETLGRHDAALRRVDRRAAARGVGGGARRAAGTRVGAGVGGSSLVGSGLEAGVGGASGVGSGLATGVGATDGCGCG